MRQIDADKLPEHKFTRESAKGSDYMRGWNDAIDTIVDNEPTVNDCPNCEYKKNYDYLSSSSSYKELQALRKFKKDNERPQGEWDYEKIAFYGVCSNCGVTVTNNLAEMFLYEEIREFPHAINFCPNCGADMRGGRR